MSPSDARTHVAGWADEVMTSTTITDEDIDRVSAELGIEVLDDQRRYFLSNLSSFDASACPGSGKTTLVVAKLRLLTKAWQSRTRGICILSHTNVAKNEINKRFQLLGEPISTDGRPHFVGTIQGFVDKFLAVPYLLSIGIEPRVIDDRIAARVRRNLLGSDRFGLESYLARNHHSLDAIALRVADLQRPFGDKLLDLAGLESASYRNAARAIRESIRAGYLTYGDMFVFAEKYLDDHPEVIQALRIRFPVVVLDEMQDTTSQQSSILERIFPPSAAEITVQRVGDPNQAIFGAHAINGFPQADHLSIANSFRVDESIARIASPFAAYPIEPDGLHGVKRIDYLTKKEQVFFAFDESRTGMVIPAFADLVAEMLPSKLIIGSKVSAVGSRHKGDDDELDVPAHFPKYLQNYFPSYKPPASDKVRRFGSLLEYVVRARRLVANSNAMSSGSEVLADGLLRHMDSNVAWTERIRVRGHRFRQMMELVESASIETGPIRGALRELLDVNVAPSADGWGDAFSVVALAVAQVASFMSIEPTADGFFAAPTVQSLETALGLMEALHENSYRSIGHGASEIVVEVGTIHSVKGETHVATLILDTYMRARFVKMLMPWFVGKKSSADLTVNDANLARLHECYVAMTRPTHLLAIAAPFKSLGSTPVAIEKSISLLEKNGWLVRRIAA